MEEQSGVSRYRGQRAKSEFLWATEPGDLLLGNQLSGGCCSSPFPGVSQTPTLCGPRKAGRKEKQEPKHSWATLAPPPTVLQ